ncbi:DoxX family protein [Actinoallomurus sp. CA-150999]|uniref:DoxX family protein n=1 Tax=Actinoallomurus sp. CA-150999 TaxID=3239887 RepID=UPI003D9238AF
MSITLTIILAIFLVVVGSLRIAGYPPIRSDAERFGIPYIAYRWLGASELICAAILISGLAFWPLAFAAAAYMAAGAAGALLLHVRAGDPMNRRVGALAVVLMAASVGLMSAFSP